MSDYLNRTPSSRNGIPGVEKARSARQAGFSVIEISLAAVIFIVLTAISLPALNSALRNFRSSGDAREVSSSIALAKMRAAADFTQTRVYADLAANQFYVQVWDKTGSTWTTEGGATSLAEGDSFGYGSLSTPPSSTQSSIGQAGACRNDANNGDLSNTACILFNSRGIPIDSTGAPTSQDALYLNDGTAAYGVTVDATGQLKLWRSDLQTLHWVQR